MEALFIFVVALVLLIYLLPEGEPDYPAMGPGSISAKREENCVLHQWTIEHGRMHCSACGKAVLPSSKPIRAAV